MKNTQCKIQCLNCDKEFSVKNYRKDEAKYCSRECRSIHLCSMRRKNTCKNCLKEFIKPHNGQRVYEFCSTECCAKKNKSKSKIENTCEYCNKTFLIGSYYKNQKYCSNICRTNASNKGKTSESIKIRSSIQYNQWRTSVFKRDNYTCTNCNISSKCGFSVILNAHHIKSFALYPNLRLDINNGITLCENCHKKTDNFGRPKKNLVRSGI